MVYRVRLFRVQCCLKCFQGFKMLFPLLPRLFPPIPSCSLILSCWLYKSLHFALSKVHMVYFLSGWVITGLQGSFATALNLVSAARQHVNLATKPPPPPVYLFTKVHWGLRMRAHINSFTGDRSAVAVGTLQLLCAALLAALVQLPHHITLTALCSLLAFCDDSHWCAMHRHISGSTDDDVNLPLQHVWILSLHCARHLSFTPCLLPNAPYYWT